MLNKLKSLLEEIGPQEGKYLVSCFIQEGKWKIDFYSKDKHKIYTFEKVGDVWKAKEDDIFQKKKKVLEPLVLDKVKISYDEAVKKVPNDTKTITILQVIDEKIVWNFTLLTPEFKVINIKVDAITGEEISRAEGNLLNFKKDSLNLS